MYVNPHKRNLDALVEVGPRCEYQGNLMVFRTVFRTLCCVFLQELRWLLTVVVAGQSVQHLDVNVDG